MQEETQPSNEHETTDEMSGAEMPPEDPTRRAEGWPVDPVYVPEGPKLFVEFLEEPRLNAALDAMQNYVNEGHEDYGVLKDLETIKDFYVTQRRTLALNVKRSSNNRNMRGLSNPVSPSRKFIG